jgi:hypothetical protein
LIYAIVALGVVCLGLLALLRSVLSDHRLECANYESTAAQERAALLASVAKERAELLDRIQRPDRLPVQAPVTFQMPEFEPDEIELVGTITMPDELDLVGTNAEGGDA